MTAPHGQAGDSTQPMRLSDQERAVGADGTVQLPMTGMNETSAYQSSSPPAATAE